MTTIVTRSGKGSSLSWAEADANLTNLNTDKLEASALAPYLTSATAASTYETQTHASSTYETQTHSSSTYPTKANNLSDLTSASTARTNLGLGDAATKTIGTSSGQVPTADQIPSLVPSSASILGAFRNLQASANGTTANVVVTADELIVENASNAYVTLRSISLTIAGTTTGANALDTGTIATSTWYSVWVIYNGTTTAGLLSTSATSPTLPSGYTHKARVGWIRTDATGNKYPLAFKQYGRRVHYVVAAGSNVTGMPQLFTGLTGNPTTPTYTATSVVNFVPTTASQIRIFAVTVGSGAFGTVAPNGGYGTFNGTTVSASNPAPINVTSGGGAVQGPQFCDLFLESANIYIASSGGSGISVWCAGWEDNL